MAAPSRVPKTWVETLRRAGPRPESCPHPPTVPSALWVLLPELPPECSLRGSGLCGEKQASGPCPGSYGWLTPFSVPLASFAPPCDGWQRAPGSWPGCTRSGTCSLTQILLQTARPLLPLACVALALRGDGWGCSRSGSPRAPLNNNLAKLPSFFFFFFAHPISDSFALSKSFISFELQEEKRKKRREEGSQVQGPRAPPPCLMEGLDTWASLPLGCLYCT